MADDRGEIEEGLLRRRAAFEERVLVIQVLRDLVENEGGLKVCWMVD